MKTRLHRARATRATSFEQRIGAQLDETYAFGAQRCDHVVATGLARLAPSR